MEEIVQVARVEVQEKLVQRAVEQGVQVPTIEIVPSSSPSRSRACFTAWEMAIVLSTPKTYFSRFRRSV